MSKSKSTNFAYCPLCNTCCSAYGNSTQLKHYQCSVCEALFIPQKDQLSFSEEKERYLLHSGEINDGYRNFVKPLVDLIANENTTTAIGLDLGAGHSAIAALMLSEKGFTMEKYDPYFHPDRSVLDKQYDFIVSCEVIEHFAHPKQEFEKINNLLKVGGKIYCKTEFYDSNINFETWYYKNDPTHVFIYTHKTIQWIQKEMGFSHAVINGRIAVLTK
ncbi:MAG: class I SAM-dependent methyltransferase [Salinivirgaceae bacterium]|nr:class I SAM-dependent methyltransferase [Salinivirgaceae bacterium]MDY0280605.1 class I SAM-dependent methyltransferase [Salinivirgaceae bacterium]